MAFCFPVISIIVPPTQYSVITMCGNNARFLWYNIRFLLVL